MGAQPAPRRVISLLERRTTRPLNAAPGCSVSRVKYPAGGCRHLLQSRVKGPVQKSATVFHHKGPLCVFSINNNNKETFLRQGMCCAWACGRPGTRRCREWRRAKQCLILEDEALLDLPGRRVLLSQRWRT